jgi:hypothetical protein
VLAGMAVKRGPCYPHTPIATHKPNRPSAAGQPGRYRALGSRKEGGAHLEQLGRGGVCFGDKVGTEYLLGPLATIPAGGGGRRGGSTCAELSAHRRTGAPAQRAAQPRASPARSRPQAAAPTPQGRSAKSLYHACLLPTALQYLVAEARFIRWFLFFWYAGFSSTCACNVPGAVFFISVKPAAEKGAGRQDLISRLGREAPAGVISLKRLASLRCRNCGRTSCGDADRPIAARRVPIRLGGSERVAASRGTPAQSEKPTCRSAGVGGTVLFSS